jgi:hypothetical protein
MIKVYRDIGHGLDVPGLDQRFAGGHLMKKDPLAATDPFELSQAFLGTRVRAK